MIKEGIYIVIINLIIICCSLLTKNINLSFSFLFIIIFIFYFFREPERIVNYLDDYCYSPCDGEIIKIDPILIENKNYICISIYLNIFDAHRNWLPVNGIVKNIKYIEGEFKNVLNEKSNAKVTTHLTTKYGDVFIDQITGFFTRRIKNYLVVGNDYNIGYPFGFIVLGSKIKIYIPDKSIILVNIGEKCIGGKTILAKFL